MPAFTSLRHRLNAAASLLMRTTTVSVIPCVERMAPSLTEDVRWAVDKFMTSGQWSSHFVVHPGSYPRMTTYSRSSDSSEENTLRSQGASASDMLEVTSALELILVFVESVLLRVSLGVVVRL